MGDRWEEDGGPAFPSSVERPGDEGSREVISYKGMSLRDWFAGQALAGILACPADYAGAKGFDGRVARAYEYADAMLKQREVGHE